jgi:hypothetical protein
MELVDVVEEFITNDIELAPFADESVCIVRMHE